MVFPGGTIPVPVIALVCERRVRTGLIRGGGVLASPVDGSAGRMDSEKSRPAERSTREEGKKRREDTALRWGFARCPRGVTISGMYFFGAGGEDG